MSSLADFVKDQKEKSTGSLSSMATSLSGSFSKTMSSFTNRNQATSEDLNPLIEDSGDIEDNVTTRNNRARDSGGRWNLLGMNIPFTGNQQPTESDCFGLGYIQRIGLLAMCLAMSAFCFLGSLTLLPVLIVSTKKFATLNTLGLVFLLLGFCFFLGWKYFLKILISENRRLISAFLMVSVIFTLYASLSVSFISS
uniref:Vesicle transport protein n=1 Tax=Rhabditophanes sp. KR3021 TaxID=114890 RepID=A0AC35TZT4_9BILA